MTAKSERVATVIMAMGKELGTDQELALALRLDNYLDLLKKGEKNNAKRS